MGIITVKELLKVLVVREEISGGKPLSTGQLFLYVSKNTTASDIMSSPISVKKSDSLEKALDKFVNYGLEELPVIDENGVIIGDLDAYELLQKIE